MAQSKLFPHKKKKRRKKNTHTTQPRNAHCLLPPRKHAAKINTTIPSLLLQPPPKLKGVASKRNHWRVSHSLHDNGALWCTFCSKVFFNAKLVKPCRFAFHFGCRRILEIYHLLHQRSIATTTTDHPYSQQSCVLGISNCDSSYRNAPWHLHNRIQRVYPAQSRGFDRNANHWQWRHCCDHAWQVCRTTRTSNDTLEAARYCTFGVPSACDDVIRREHVSRSRGLPQREVTDGLRRLPF